MTASLRLNPLFLFFLYLCLAGAVAPAQPLDPAFPSPKTEDAADYLFNDTPKTRELHHPSWFKHSFLNLPEELTDAKKRGKLGIIVYFGQENCAYCERLLTVNFTERKDIVLYTQKFFEVIAIDIWGQLPLITPAGQQMTEKSYADQEKTNFTPSLIFYTLQGEEIFRMRGYYPPYRFRAALDYVVGEYYRQENFRQYLERAEPGMVFAEEDLNFNALFSAPPYLLNRHQSTAERPLAVFFEQPNCHACDLLHSGPLQNPALLADLKKMEVVQLNLWADTPVQTPSGDKISARAWADQLGLFYTPTLLFFDEQGQEIIRVDSTVQLYRLSKVLKYILDKEYRRYPLFQRWHTEQVIQEQK